MFELLSMSQAENCFSLVEEVNKGVRKETKDSWKNIRESIFFNAEKNQTDELKL